MMVQNLIAMATVASMLALGSAACSDDKGPLNPAGPSAIPASAAGGTATNTAAAGVETQPANQDTPEHQLVERPGAQRNVARDDAVLDSLTVTTYNDGTAEWKIRVIKVDLTIADAGGTHRVQARSTLSYPRLDGTRAQHTKTRRLSPGQFKELRGNIIPGAQYCVYAQGIHEDDWSHSLGCVTTPPCRDDREYDSDYPYKCRPKQPPEPPLTPIASNTCSDTRYQLATIEAHHAGETLSSTYADNGGCVHLYLPSGLNRGTNPSLTNMTQAPQCSAGFYVRNDGNDGLIASCRRWGRN